MQTVDRNGERGNLKFFDQEKLEESLKDPNVDHVRVFQLKRRMKVIIQGTAYKVIAVRPNGKITMKLMGPVKDGEKRIQNGKSD